MFKKNPSKIHTDWGKCLNLQERGTKHIQLVHWFYVLLTMQRKLSLQRISSWFAPLLVGPLGHYHLLFLHPSEGWRAISYLLFLQAKLSMRWQISIVWFIFILGHAKIEEIWTICPHNSSISCMLAWQLCEKLIELAYQVPFFLLAFKFLEILDSLWKLVLIRELIQIISVALQHT